MKTATREHNVNPVTGRCVMCGRNGFQRRNAPICDYGARIAQRLADSDSDTEHHDTPAAPERGDRDPRTVIVDLIGQRERLIQTLQAASSTLKSYQYGNVSPELAKEMIRTIEQVITTSEQEER